MLKKKYTHIFFDLDNTLWDFDVNSFYAMQETYSFYNLHAGNSNFQLFFSVFCENNRLLWAEYRKGAVVKKDLTRLRFQQTFEKLNISGIDPCEMNEHYLMEMPKQNRLVKGAEQLLGYLKSKGYALFIITNGFSQVQHKKLETAGIKHYFRKIFISEEVKAPKPSRQIFEFALKSANAPKSSSLMVGDDFHSDVLGALNIGIDVVYLDAGNNVDLNLYDAGRTLNNTMHSIVVLSDLYRLV